MKELNEAQVIAVGPGGLDKEGKRIQPSVAAGDKVLIPQVRKSYSYSYSMRRFGSSASAEQDDRVSQHMLTHNTVRWQPNQDRRGRILPLQGQRVCQTAQILSVTC